VCFDDDVEFKDDVTIQGPSDSDDSSTDFEIKGHVSVDFEQDQPFDVHTTTRFRDDVLIKKRERSKNTKKSGSNDEERDEDPTLTVGGDITTHMGLFVAEVIDVQGDGESRFAGDVTVDGKLTSVSQMVTGDFEAMGAVKGNTLESTTTTTVGTALGVTGGTSTGGLSSTTGTFIGAVSTGALTATGDSVVIGDLNVEGEVRGNGPFVDCSVPVVGCSNFVPP
jgi:hypothetical protein